MFLNSYLCLLFTAGLLFPSSTLANKHHHHHHHHQQQQQQQNLRRKTYDVDNEQIHRVFIQYKQGSHDDTKQRIIGNSRSIKLLYDFQNLDTFVASIKHSELERIKQDPNIQSIIEDPPRSTMYMEPSGKQMIHHHLSSLTTDQELPYGIEMVQAPQAWQYGIKGNGVKVCVIDSGMDAYHPDIDELKLSGLEVPNLDWRVDGLGHGTHVTGTIAAKDNDFGVVGVAPEADIYVVRVFADSGGFAYASGIVDAANKCMEAGAKIVSMSLGGPIWNPFEFRAFTNLQEQGVLTIAAAGNGGNNRRSYPASYNGVMSVAAIDERKEIAFFSQQNARVDIAAPGVDVLSLFPTDGNCLICESINALNGYGVISGTSMATPHVSGVAALLWSRFPNATPEQISNAMEVSAQDLGRSGRDNAFGHGLVQALGALEVLNGGPLGDDDIVDDSPPIEDDGDDKDDNGDNIIGGCGLNEVYFELRLSTDDYAYETWWDLVRLFDNGTHLSGAGYESNSDYVIGQCVPDDCYTFNIYDSVGDGLCCGYGEGEFQLLFDGVEITSGSSGLSPTMSYDVGVCNPDAFPKKQ